MRKTEQPDLPFRHACGANGQQVKGLPTFCRFLAQIAPVRGTVLASFREPSRVPTGEDVQASRVDHNVYAGSVGAVAGL